MDAHIWYGGDLGWAHAFRGLPLRELDLLYISER